MAEIIEIKNGRITLFTVGVEILCAEILMFRVTLNTLICKSKQNWFQSIDLACVLGNVSKSLCTSISHSANDNFLSDC